METNHSMTYNFCSYMLRCINIFSEVSQARKINKKKQELKKNEKAQMLREYLFEKEMAFLRVSFYAIFI